MAQSSPSSALMLPQPVPLPRLPPSNPPTSTASMLPPAIPEALPHASPSSQRPVPATSPHRVCPWDWRSLHSRRVGPVTACQPARAREEPESKEGSWTNSSLGLQNTDKRSALRITRESELLGGQLKAYHTREALVVEAAFLREDLPYFTELLGEVITKTRYTSRWSPPSAKA